MATERTRKRAGSPGPKAVVAMRSRAGAATLARLEELLEVLLVEVRGDVPEYAAMDAAKLATDVRPLFRAMVLMLVRAAGGESKPEPSTLALLRERAQLQASEGLPLHALLSAYSVCMRLVWRYLVDDLVMRARDPAVAAQAANEMSVAVVRLREKLTGEVADAHTGRERKLAETAESLRHDVIEQLLTNETQSADTMLGRIEHMGYRLGDSHAVAVFTIDGLEMLAPGLRDPAERIMQKLPDAVRGLAVTCAEPLVEVRYRRLAGILGSSVVAILPFEGEVSEARLKAAIETAVGPLDLPPGCHMLVGLGLVEDGIGGIAVSYQQAQRALEAARATGAHVGVVSYTEALPTLILLREPTLAQDSWLATVKPLFAHDADHGTHLVSTLSAYLEERGVLAATARALFIHRHTLTTRLEQIEKLTGRSLRNHDDLLMLELGLRAHLFDEEATRRSRDSSAPSHLQEGEDQREGATDQQGDLDEGEHEAEHHRNGGERARGPQHDPLRSAHP